MQHRVVISGAWLPELWGEEFSDRQVPHLNHRDAAHTAGLAFIAAGGGVAARSGVRTLRGRFARARDQTSKPA